ncbi:MAG: hypothetical protein ACTSR8_21585 [Promethearchaeota archaeon]
MCTKINLPDESDFRNYTQIEEYLKTNEGNKFYHDLYLKAVNHPIRREILAIVFDKKKILKQELFEILKNNKILEEKDIFNYNIDYLIKALCIKRIEEKGEVFLIITQSGEIVGYLQK